jgi:hypothetical protein
MISSHDGGPARVWDARSGLLIGSISMQPRNVNVHGRMGPRHPGASRAATFCGTGLVAVAWWPAKITIHDADTLAALREIALPPEIVYDLIGSDDGKRLAVRTESQQMLFDVEDGRMVSALGASPRRYHDDARVGSAFTDDGRTLLHIQADGRCQLLDATDGKPRAMPDSLPRTTAVSLSGDGRRLVVGGETPRLYDLAAGRELAFPRFKKPAEWGNDIELLALDATGKQLAVMRQKSIHILDLDRNEEVAALKTGLHSPRAAALASA